MQSCLRFILFVLLLITIVPSAFSQDISFNKIPLPEEMNNGTITGFCQDLEGNMWISVNNSGIWQYDGVHFKNYSHDPLNSASLIGNNVECLMADRSGIIWVGTWGEGLERFDPQTGLFVHFQHSGKDPNSIADDSITCLLQDHDGTIWVGTEHGGLNSFENKTGKFTHYRHNENDPNSLSFDMVRTIYEDKKGNLWVGTGSPFLGAVENINKKGGLNLLDRHSGKFTRYMHDEKNEHSLIDNRVRAIFEDSHGNFWVGTAGDGLHTMNRENGTFERHTIDPLHPEKLSRPPIHKMFGYADDHITFITEDIKRNIWVGTFGSGMMKYDQDNKTVTHFYKAKSELNNSFTDSTTWQEFTSRDGVMWVSSWFKEDDAPGLYKFDPSQQIISHTDIPNKGALNAFLETPGNIQWLGMDSGLIRKDLTNNRSEFFAADPKKPGAIGNNIIMNLYMDRKNRIWVCAAGQGWGTLNLFNPDNKNFTVYRHDPAVENSLASDPYTVFEDDHDDLWIGTSKGLDKFDEGKKVFIHNRPFAEDTLNNGKNLVTSILLDSQKRLWVGTYVGGGIHIFNRETGSFKHYLAHHNVIAITQGQDGKIYAGAEDGLYFYNSEIDSFSVFVDPSTSSSIITHAMVRDNDNNLWISSFAGIFKVNPELMEVSRYSKNFGIDGATLTFISAYKTKDGTLLFGNRTGYYSVVPGKISSNPNPPEIVLTDFRIADQHMKIHNKNISAQDIFKAGEIRMSYDQDAFSFFFNVVHYSNPDLNKAMYLLENYDKNWRPAGSDHIAYYYNVPPGHYKFRVKAASVYGVWSEKTLDVIITPPWWRTWWAYTIFAICFIAISFFVNRLVRRNIISKEKAKTRERELAQAKEIEKAYNELKITQAQLIQSEKMASLGELTAGIAHEIQNPLNFVNNFSEVNKELITELKQEIRNRNLDAADEIANDIEANEDKINHHGKRAEAIVKGMLQHSRNSTSQREPTDINALADEYLRLAYHGLRAKEKSFNATLETDFDESIGNINIIPQDIGRVLLNLFNNAFYAVSVKKSDFAKATSQGSGFAGAAGKALVDEARNEYKPTVTVRTKKMVGKVVISIKDNGNGIPKKIVDKIFQPFFTTKPTGQGTGLGLSLSYDIIKAHGGEIKVETTEGEGTAFIITI